MRVRVSYTIEADDDFRRAIRLHYGKPGLASRAEVQEWMRNYGEAMNGDLSRSLDFDA